MVIFWKIGFGSILSVLAWTASGQVIKCVDPVTKKTTYGDEPCKVGASRLVDTSDSAVIDSKPLKRAKRIADDAAARSAAASPAEAPVSEADSGMGLLRYREQSMVIGSIDMTLLKARRLANAAIHSQSIDAVEDAMRVISHHRMTNSGAYGDLVACHATLRLGHSCR